MKIIFDLRSTGLGNGGGSYTLIKSGNVLVDLGHEVIFIDSGKNQHTWTKLKAKHLIIKNINNVPSADFIIATGYNSVSKTVMAPVKCGRKLHWLRGFELWVMSEKKIINNIFKAPTIKLVNSIGLQNKLLQYNINSHIIYPGNDFEDLFPLNLRNTNKIILGGLYHTKHMTKRSRWILKAVNILKKKYNIELHMFGTNPKPNISIIDNYIQSPTIKEKNKFFNKIDIFLSPTELEGLHIVPQEAMLTGCPVIGTNAELSGMQDYLKHNYNGLISDNNFQSFLKNIIILIKDKTLRHKLSINTIKTIKDLGDREYNMKKLIKYLKSI